MTDVGGRDPARELLRHAVATVAYRGGKAIRGAPAGFESFHVVESARTRTPGQILAHIGDLFDWALSLAKGGHEWKETPSGAWEADSERFFASLERFDALLASDAPLARSPEKLFQGPVADALAHVGQIALLRRLAGGAIKGENYFKADIAAGRIGAEQAEPRMEFE
jgi:hypothetical protein